MKLIILLLLTSSSLSFEFRSYLMNRPGPGKEATGGEDAYYHDKHLLVVADGVGGWNEAGVDPSRYSKQLVKNVEEYFKSDPRKYSKDPKELTIIAGKSSNEIGSSTLVVVTIDQDTQEVVTSNVGDSGFAIFRKNEEDLYELIEMSQQQQHEFNFPFQLGTNGDDPAKAERSRFKIKKNDILVVASDGLWDNMFDEDIVKLINSVKTAAGMPLEKLVDRIINQTFNNSRNNNYMSPFAKGAKDNGMQYIGGKPDDITIIVAEVI
jgi:protein phosphatase PTC7